MEVLSWKCLRISWQTYAIERECASYDLIQTALTKIKIKAETFKFHVYMMNISIGFGNRH